MVMVLLQSSMTAIVGFNSFPSLLMFLELSYGARLTSRLSQTAAVSSRYSTCSFSYITCSFLSLLRPPPKQKKWGVEESSGKRITIFNLHLLFIPSVWSVALLSTCLTRSLHSMKAWQALRVKSGWVSFFFWVLRQLPDHPSNCWRVFLLLIRLEHMTWHLGAFQPHIVI